MARSRVVYVVMDGGRPMAAFTVKHELVTWLQAVWERRNQSVWRLSDGTRYHRSMPEPVELSVTDLLGA